LHSRRIVVAEVPTLNPVVVPPVTGGTPNAAFCGTIDRSARSVKHFSGDLLKAHPIEITPEIPAAHPLFLDVDSRL
jgi:hypothetical protein